MIEEREETRYDRRAFALAYIDAHPANQIPYRNPSYDAVVRVHRQQILSGLQDLFGLTLERDAVPAEGAVLFMLFESTVNSYLAPRMPWDDHAAAGLIVERLEATGQRPAVEDASDRIRSINGQSREAHLDLLAALLAGMLGEQAAKVFTSADLRAIGIDDTAPDPDDHPVGWDDD